MSMRTAESAAAEDVPPQAFRRLVGNARLPGLPADVSVVTESDLAPLPQAAQRYLRPLTAWDTYLDGRGRMRGKVLGLVPVVDGLGPHFDTSELVTWLNDAVLMAPSMLLTPAITWSAGPDADSFDVAVTDGGRTVSARVGAGPAWGTA